MKKDALKPFDTVYLLTSPRFGDNRGYFCQTWSRQLFIEELEITADFIQDCHSYNAEPNTLRGLHAQTQPHAQDKLVRVIQGSIWDFVVDARPGSPTYGTWTYVKLSAEIGDQLFIPQGYLHGFLTIEPHTIVHYKIAGAYSPTHAVTVDFNDPDIGINLQQELTLDIQTMIRSGADLAGKKFRDLQPIL